MLACGPVEPLQWLLLVVSPDCRLCGGKGIALYTKEDIFIVSSIS